MTGPLRLMYMGVRWTVSIMFVPQDPCREGDCSEYCCCRGGGEGREVEGRGGEGGEGREVEGREVEGRGEEGEGWG